MYPKETWQDACEKHSPDGLAESVRRDDRVRSDTSQSAEPKKTDHTVRELLLLARVRPDNETEEYPALIIGRIERQAQDFELYVPCTQRLAGQDRVDGGSERAIQIDDHKGIARISLINQGIKYLTLQYFCKQCSQIDFRQFHRIAAAAWVGQGACHQSVHVRIAHT